MSELTHIFLCAVLKSLEIALQAHLSIKDTLATSECRNGSLNYSLAACLQDNSRPKSPTKVETKRKLQQFTVSGWLIMNRGESGNEKKETFRVEITFNMKHQYNY